MASDADHFMVMTVDELFQVSPLPPESKTKADVRSPIDARPDPAREKRLAEEWDNALNALARDGWYYHSRPSPGIVLFERRD